MKFVNKLKDKQIFPWQTLKPSSYLLAYKQEGYIIPTYEFELSKLEIIHEITFFHPPSCFLCLVVCAYMF